MAIARRISGRLAGLLVLLLVVSSTSGCVRRQVEKAIGDLGLSPEQLAAMQADQKDIMERLDLMEQRIQHLSTATDSSDEQAEALRGMLR